MRYLYWCRWRRSLCEDGSNGIEYGDMQLIAEAYSLLKVA